MEDEIKLKKGEPCPFCGNTQLKECSNCKKIICLNCLDYVKLPSSKGYLCGQCIIKNRDKKIRGS